MDLITAGMFVVGLAVGSGGILMFKKKNTVVQPPQPSNSVAIHNKDNSELDKLNQELNELRSNSRLEKQNFENEISQLKKQEGQLKDQLSSISSHQNSNQNDKNLVLREQLKNEIEAKANEISRLIEKNKHQEMESSTFDNERRNIEQQAQTFINNLTEEFETKISRLENQLANASSVQPVTQSNSSPIKPIKERKLLVVDDSKVVRNKLSSTLKKAGYTVELAEDGKDALNKLATMKDFDLIVTDLEMPNIDGHQLITAVHSDASIKHIPVVAITGHEEITINVVHSEGLVGVHKKPWKDDELLRKLEALSGLK